MATQIDHKKRTKFNWSDLHPTLAAYCPEYETAHWPNHQDQLVDSVWNKTDDKDCVD